MHRESLVIVSVSSFIAMTSVFLGAAVVSASSPPSTMPGNLKNSVVGTVTSVPIKQLFTTIYLFANAFGIVLQVAAFISFVVIVL
ncbi:hypothetical protein BDR26DRAFT_853329 [Obelidium mucronatum]|nr:hypothetical protein BDR26DRAFT_853329 [Obelidium mucronatum]